MAFWPMWRYTASTFLTDFTCLKQLIICLMVSYFFLFPALLSVYHILLAVALIINNKFWFYCSQIGNSTYDSN